jgi:hypothetical protein
VDRHRPRSVIHAMNAVRRCRERLPRYEVARVTRPSDGERLAGDPTFEDVDAHARSAVVVEARVSSLPPVIEPGFRVVVTPQELERSLADPLELAEHDQVGRRPRELHALVRREVVVAQRQSEKAGVLGHGAILHPAARFRTARR